MIYSTRMIITTLLQIFVYVTSQKRLSTYISGQKADDTKDNLNIAELFEAMSQEFTPTCLRIAVGEVIDVHDTRNNPFILLHHSGNKSKAAVKFINRYAGLIKHPCLTYIVFTVPSRDVLRAMADLKDKTIARYFFARLSTRTEANKFLLDEDLRNEENVAAMVKANDSNIWDIYTRQLLHPSGFPTVSEANQWIPEKRTFRKNKHLFPEQMGNFYGNKLKGVTLDFRPFTDYKPKNGSRKVEPKPCLDVYILDVIARYLNFTYELEMPPDGLWGTMDDKGHWNGVVGEVEYRRANFSLVLSVTLERRWSVDFTRVYFIDSLSFVTAKNRPQPPWQKLIDPFNDRLWTIVVVLVFLVIGLYYGFFITQSTIGSFRNKRSRAFTHITGAFLSQSLFNLPRLTASQVLLGFWILYSFLLTSYYKTALTASFAVPKIPPTINTLTQLLNSDLDYGMIDAKGSEYQLFSTSNVTLYKQLFRQMTFYSSAESMSRVAEGEYSYIYFKSNLQTIVSTEFTSTSGETNLHIASEEFFPGGYGWAFPKGAPYRRTFDMVMLKCMQAGLIEKWVKDLYAIYLRETESLKTPEEKRKAKEDAAAKKTDGLVVLNLYHFQGAFLALCFGYGFGAIILGLEIFIFKITTQRNPSAISFNGIIKTAQ